MNNRKKMLISGIKSGLIAGVVTAILFGICLTGYLGWIERPPLWGLFLVLPYFLAFGIPIGMLIGSLLGLIIGYIMFKKSEIVQHIQIISVTIGGLVGSIYFIFYLLQNPLSPSKLQEGIFSLVAGIICGGIGGLIGSKRFLATTSMILPH